MQVRRIYQHPRDDKGQIEIPSNSKAGAELDGVQKEFFVIRRKVGMTESQIWEEWEPHYLAWLKSMGFG